LENVLPAATSVSEFHRSKHTQVLRCKEHAHNLRAPEVDTLEAVDVVRSGCDILLELSRVAHHVDSLMNIEVGVGFGRGEAEERSLCVLETAFADEPGMSEVPLAKNDSPPRTLRSEENANDQRGKPHPLRDISNCSDS
jgi:hypothetical protein